VLVCSRLLLCCSTGRYAAPHNGAAAMRDASRDSSCLYGGLVVSHCLGYPWVTLVERVHAHVAATAALCDV
jgi:hypothetical protein